ncbi:MAG: DUF2169 domain-containing protein [Polyangiaceae bacterium]
MAIQLPLLHSVAECDAEIVPWRLPSGPRFTIIAKVAFPIAAGEVRALAARPELVDRDRHIDRNPVRSLAEASDLVPLLPHAEVLVTGHAYVPGGRAAPALNVGLRVVRATGVVLDKHLQVYGDRRDANAVPAPFQRMPIVWERALATSTNPFGVKLPNFVDPRRPTEAVGLGPICAAWPERKNRLGDLSIRALETEPIELPVGFDFNFFHAAPADQRIDSLSGDEWVVLDGLHPALPRVEFRLPGCLLVARLIDPQGTRTSTLRLIPDRLVCDTDRQRATLTYRAGFASAWEALANHRVEVGLAMPGQAVAFPQTIDPSTARGRARARQPVIAAATQDVSDLLATALGTSGPASEALPFSQRSPEPIADEYTSTIDIDASRAVRQAMPFAHRAGEAPPASQANAAFAMPFAPASGAGGTADLDPESITGEPTAVPFSGAPDLNQTMGLPQVPLAPFPAPVAPPPAVAPPAPIETPPPAFIPAAPPALLSTPQPAPAEPSLAAPMADELSSTMVGAYGTANLDPDEILNAPLLPFQPSAGATAERAHRPATAEGLPFVGGQTDPGKGPPPVDSKRTSETVPTLTDAPLVVATLAWQLKPPQDVLIVIVKATFDLVQGAAATLRAEPEMPTGDLFADDEVDKELLVASDFALFKPEVDVIVRGTAYAPGGQSTAMQISLRISGAAGTLDHAVAVFGDRMWTRSPLGLVPTAPAAFDKIPLGYGRAFGGPEFAGNPHGVGHRGAPGPDGARRLPNFEKVGDLIKAPTDTPAPAGLGALHPMWRTRAALLGSYDAAWFRTRWPYFPDDFDYRYYQAAPPSQRLRKVDGDEAYELVGLHPKHGALAGKLGGVRARAFAHRTAEAGGNLTEINLRIDTVTFSPDDNAVHVVWRGLLDVSDDDAPELAEIFATTEPLAGPALGLDEVRARLEAAKHPPPAEEDGLIPVDSIPAPPVGPDEEELEGLKIEASIRAHEAEVAALLPAAAANEEHDEAPLPEPDPEAIGEVMREGGATEEEIAELQQALKPEGTVPPPAPAVDLRAFVLERIENGEALSGLDLAGADLSDLDLSAESFSDANLTGANLARAKLSSSDLSRALLANANFDGAVLEQALLTDADLTEASFVNATLEGALLDGVEGRGLKATQANLTGAMLAKAILTEADLTEAKLDRADLSQVDLTGARLDRASFKEAVMPAAKLYDVHGEGVVFDRAQMTNARAEGASLKGSFFRDVSGDESVWERAELGQANFHGASLREASFHRASCQGASFNQCDLSSARMRKSRLSGAAFLRANMMEAKFDRANLENADLRGANLHAASLHKTFLKNAKLDEAITTFTELDKRQP